jgi:hypothetical protein
MRSCSSLPGVFRVQQYLKDQCRHHLLFDKSTTYARISLDSSCKPSHCCQLFFCFLLGRYGNLKLVTPDQKRQHEYLVACWRVVRVWAIEEDTSECNIIAGWESGFLTENLIQLAASTFILLHYKGMDQTRSTERMGVQLGGRHKGFLTNSLKDT